MEAREAWNLGHFKICFLAGLGLLEARNKLFASFYVLGAVDVQPLLVRPRE